MTPTPREPIQLVPPLAPDETHDWREDALCRQTDPELFYPTENASTKPARRTCAACTVRAECLTAGMDERHGIWGGLTASQRAELRARRA